MSRGNGGFVKLAVAAVVLSGIAVLAACASSGTAKTGGVLTKPIDPRQQTLVPWGTRSHWLQPWRAYLDTLPAGTLLGALGINFNVDAAAAPATARLLAAAGFRRARVEIPWSAYGYDSPSQLTNAADFRTRLLALKENGIRPLILLNANDLKPCPTKRVTLRLAQPASKGARDIRLDPSSVSLVVPGKTGFNIRKEKSGKVLIGGALITDVASDGTARLSQPLTKDLPAGPEDATVFLYGPFPGPKQRDGSANSSVDSTMNGWLEYAGNTARFVKSVLGDTNFDVEIWNELTFGSAFLQIGSYYDPLPNWAGKGDVTKAILERTVAYLRDPANGVSGIGIGDGFANQTPFASAEESPPGLTAIDKHPYPKIRHFPETGDERAANGKPVDALGNPTTFEPTYTAFFPEYFLTAIQTESLIRDLSPMTTNVHKAKHGRNVAPQGGGKPPTVWITETNMNPKKLASGISEATFQRLQAKAALRTLVSYVNKGVSAVYFFAAKGGALGLVRTGAGGGTTLTALRRLVATVGKPAGAIRIRPLTLLSISDNHDQVQFQGNGMPGNPPLYNRDVVTFFPFQTSAKRYVVATYVMTRNIDRDLAPAYYDLTVGNLGPGKWKFALTDPLTGKAPALKVLSLRNGLAVLHVPLTDSVRLLTISR